MLINQIVLIGVQGYSVIENTPTELTGNIKFSVSDYQDLTTVKFRVRGHMDVGATTGIVELYDKTNATVIAEVYFTSTTPTTEESVNISNSLPDNAELCLRAYQDGAYEDDSVVIDYAEININQDANTSTKKTVTRVQLIDNTGGTMSSTWTNTFTSIFAPLAQNLDGVVVATMEGVFHILADGQAEVRLFDKTANAVVADSTCVTTSTTNIFAETAPLTLIAGHQYQLQYRNSIDTKHGYFHNWQLKIKQSNFFKTASVVFTNIVGGNGATGTYASLAWEHDLAKSNVLGDLSTTFYIERTIRCTHADSTDKKHRLYNVTKATAVVGTEIVQNPTTVQIYFFEGAVTPSNDDDTYTFQADTLNFSYTYNGLILAVIEDTVPVTNYISPDPTQPTGYHCFIKQFVKNCLSGFIPLLTPEGANFCW